MEENRIIKLDNIKFWMIFCVVVGHVIAHFRGFPAADALYVFIYSFHMPVFMFISGMLSKHAVDEKKYNTVIEYLTVYLVMKFLEALGHYIAKGTFAFHFLWESGPAWFVLALAVFILVTMAINRYDHKIMLAVALLVGCLAGLDTHFGDHFASMRICVFYPVFLLGYYVDPKELFAKGGKLSKTAYRLLAALVLIALFVMLFIFSDKTGTLLQLFKGKYAYDDMGVGIGIVLMRLICYAVWLATGILVITLIGERETIFTWLGSRSMSIYIWHPFIIAILFDKLGFTEIVMKLFPHLFIFAAVIIAAVITVVTAYLPGVRISRKLVQ